ncbi:trichohyalin-like isoform X2 [Uranotaenia lowii]|uniref:trichohyalin-like isoform X2 n=1 Tax=Uranotaenia lowii TaxID=190385 RepID=UPI002478D5EA|nr:trichohyalin-like isoform X2 [Uranotaenia lowii]
MDFDWDNISIGEPNANDENSYFYRYKKEMAKPDIIVTTEALGSLELDKPDVLVSTEKETPVNDEIGGSGNSSERSYSSQSSASGTNSGARRKGYQKQQASIRQKETCERAYCYAQVYEEKRKALREREEKQLEEMRKFHARPAPKFGKASTERKENRQPKITIPITPKQMKPERLQKVAQQTKRMQERSKALLTDESVMEQKGPIPLNKVLHEVPFRPVLTHRVVQAEPFALHMESRLHERRQYDEQKQKEREQREHREAEERRLAEERAMKELRKHKEFKANPNPFKR